MGLNWPLNIVAIISILVAHSARADQWICTRNVEGSEGSKVHIDFYIEQKREVISRYIVWDPPHHLSDDKLYKALNDAMLSFNIEFEDASDLGIGLPTRIVVTAMGAQAKWLEDSIIEITLSDGSNYKSILRESSFSYPELMFYDADITYISEHFLDSIATAQSAHLLVRDKDGKSIGGIEYDLSGKAERNRMFKRAWKAVQGKIKDPKNCEITRKDPIHGIE